MGRPVEDEVARLQEENEALRAELARLRQGQASAVQPTCPNAPRSSSEREWDGLAHGLTRDQIGRYSRQIVLPSFGAAAQGKLCRGSVLIVGMGGLGSPAALYLAAAGVGRLGLLDKDTVELSNMHRQIIHTEATVGVHKCESARRAVHALNSSIAIETHPDGLTPENAVGIVERYDVVIDASDNAPTRYLISDACCVTGRPLVSGAAIGLEGQLTVYCGGGDGPCYRCLFPEAPLPQSCARCADAGVLGIVPGIIGTMQALEAIKLLTGIGEPLTRRLLLLDAAAGRVHAVKLRGRSGACVACGDAPSITRQTLDSYDYAAFTGQAPNDGPPKPLALVDPEHRITVQQLQERLRSSQETTVIDVRPPEQYAICSLPGSSSLPWARFVEHEGRLPELAAGGPLVVMCRRGNDSQRALQRLHQLGYTDAVDVVGGIEAWAHQVDPGYPLY